MNFSVNRFGAIITKEVKDIKNNLTFTAMMLLPLIFAYLVANTNADSPEIHGAVAAAVLSILMAVAMIGGTFPAMMIAEEKEKNTLKVLMLSPASELEVFLGKSILTLIYTVVISALCIVISGAHFANLGIVILAITLTTIFTILFGLIIGLVSPNEKATGVISMPLMLILLMPMLLSTVKSEIVQTLSNLIPTYHLGEILFKIDEGKLFSEYAKNLSGIAISIAVAAILFFIVYRRNKLSEN